MPCQIEWANRDLKTADDRPQTSADEGTSGAKRSRDEHGKTEAATWIHEAKTITGEAVAVETVSDESRRSEIETIARRIRLLATSATGDVRAELTELAAEPNPRRLARRIRLLIPSTSGDVRAELEEVRAELEPLAGPRAEVIAIAGRRP